MRKAFFLVAALFVLFPLCRFVAAGDSLLVGIDSWPPFEYVCDEEPHGLATDITVQVLQRMGVVDIDIREISWRRGMEQLAFGELDVMISALRTPDREKRVRYPEEPLHEDEWCLFVCGGRGLDALDSLEGKTVGLVHGFEYPQSLMRVLHGLARFDFAATPRKNFMKLRAGRIDALVAPRLAANWFARKLAFPCPLISVHNCARKVGIYAIFNRERVSEARVRRFSRELSAFKKKQEYRAIISRYDVHN